LVLSVTSESLGARGAQAYSITALSLRGTLIAAPA
jgi:hypothetical protein